MKYLKSALVGLAAVFVVFVILPILAAIVSIVIFVAKHGFAGIGIAFDRPHWEQQSFALLGRRVCCLRNCFSMGTSPACKEVALRNYLLELN